MNMRTMDLHEAEAYEPGPNEVCLSITSPTVEPNLQDGWKDVLSLKFSDVDTDRYPDDERLAARYPGITLFGSSMAEQIVDFIETYKSNPIVIHCESGRSRAPAVALAAYEVVHFHPPPPEMVARYQDHNRRVRRKILEAAGRQPAKGVPGA